MDWMILDINTPAERDAVCLTPRTPSDSGGGRAGTRL